MQEYLHFMGWKPSADEAHLKMHIMSVHVSVAVVRKQRVSSVVLWTRSGETRLN